MTFLKEWKDYGDTSKKVIKAFRKWEKSNLMPDKLEKSIDLTYGLPYTSSGDYAALWNTNCQALYSKDLNYHFVGLACTEHGQVIAILEDSKEKAIYIEL